MVLPFLLSPSHQAGVGPSSGETNSVMTAKVASFLLLVGLATGLRLPLHSGVSALRLPLHSRVAGPAHATADGGTAHLGTVVHNQRTPHHVLRGLPEFSTFPILLVEFEQF